MTRTAKALDRIICQSSFIIPYQTQRERPESKTISVKIEMSFTFLVLITFINCGIIANEVKIPAMSPIKSVFIKHIYFVNDGRSVLQCTLFKHMQPNI